MKVKGGRATYGEILGVIVLELKIPRIPGDAGNATTYDFPTRLKIMKPPYTYPIPAHQAAREDPKLLQAYIQAAQELEREGVRAVTTTLGFALIYQEKVQNAIKIPFFSSSLLQIPIAHRVLKKGQKLGIITADFKVLTHDFLRRAGINPSILPSIVIAGLWDEPGFNIGFEPPHAMDPEEVEKVVVRVAKRLISEHPEVGAFVFEMHNLAAYSAAVQEATGIPVFDAITLAKMAYNVVVQKRYTGLM